MANAVVKNSGASDSWDKTGYLPPDETEDKIQYGFRMIMEAHRGKTMTSENEIRSLRQSIEELKIANANLTKKYAAAEREIMEQQHRNQVLTKDNENLAVANRQLVQRCEKYKRIQQTFSEALENSGHEEDLVVSVVGQQSSLLSSEYRPAYATSSASTAGPPVASLSPKTSSTSTVAAPERSTAGSNNSFDSNGKDGKQFFRVVRTRLPFESFNAFLSIIKKLNAHEFTREAAVEEAKKIFGSENMDLLGDFQALISRHISSSSS